MFERIRKALGLTARFRDPSPTAGMYYSGGTNRFNITSAILHRLEFFALPLVKNFPGVTVHLHTSVLNPYFQYSFSFSKLGLDIITLPITLPLRCINFVAATLKIFFTQLCSIGWSFDIKAPSKDIKAPSKKYSLLRGGIRDFLIFIPSALERLTGKIINAVTINVSKCPNPGEMMRQKAVTTKEPSAAPGAYLKHDGHGHADWLTRRGTARFEVPTDTPTHPWLPMPEKPKPEQNLIETTCFADPDSTEAASVRQMAADTMARSDGAFSALQDTGFDPEQNLTDEQRAQIIEQVRTGSEEKCRKQIVLVLQDAPTSSAMPKIVEKSPIVDEVYRWAHQQALFQLVQTCV